jgi:hypothetical protein
MFHQFHQVLCHVSPIPSSIVSELVKHYKILGGIGETLQNTWWNWLSIPQRLMELVKHYKIIGGIG